MARDNLREIEDYLSPSEAGRILGTSGQWVKQLARRGELEAVETHLGWLIEPGSVERLADERVRKAEGRVSSLKTARSWSKKSTANVTVHGRAAHGKSLRAKSKRSRSK